jgi:hypothetical protein
MTQRFVVELPKIIAYTQLCGLSVEIRSKVFSRIAHILPENLLFLRRVMGSFMLPGKRYV